MALTIAELKAKFEKKPMPDRNVDPQLYIDMLTAENDRLRDDLTELRTQFDTQTIYGDMARLALFKLLPNVGDFVILDIENFNIGATHARLYKANDSEYGNYLDVQPCDAEGNIVDLQEQDHVHTDACSHG